MPRTDGRSAPRRAARIAVTESAARRGGGPVLPEPSSHRAAPPGETRSAAQRRPALPARIPHALTLACALALLGSVATGCASLAATNASDVHTAAAPSSSPSTASAMTDPGHDPGCIAALHAISTYGPSSVKLLAEGREAVNSAAVHLFVTALGAAADAAGQPAIRLDITALATAYEDYFDLTTDVVSVPLSAVLRDTVDLEGLCHE